MRQKLLFLLAALAFLLPARLYAFNYEYEGVTLRYEVTDEEIKTCRVTGYEDFSGALVIPEVANDGTSDYSVTSIGEAAFFFCSGLTSVEIPNSVTSIGEYAFRDCSGLTSVEIPNSVTEIGQGFFYGCSGLTSVEIPNSVTEIGQGAFYGCSGLTSIEIPNSVTSIGLLAFEGCSGLTSVVIPNSVTSIGVQAFCDCKNLPSVVIPNSVTSIDRYTFSGCSGLTSVEIPNSVTSIGEYAFSGCSGLTSVMIPSSVTSIGGDAFSFCSGLIKSAYPSTLGNPFGYGRSIAYNPEGAMIEDGFVYGPDRTAVYFAPLSLDGEYSIPETVTSIGGYAFSGCSGLTSVVIPNSVTEIGRDAFSGCSSLSSVEIPNSVTSIGSGAFSGCSGLIRSAYPNNLYNPFENGIAVAYDPDCDILEDGWIYNRDRSAIYFAPLDLEGDYILPETVNSIGESAFYGCGGLASVKTQSETPASMPVNAFEGLYETVGLTVPDMSAYKYLATVWGLFKNIQTSAGNELSCFSDGNLEYRLNTVDRTATVTGAKDCSSLSIPAFLTDGSDPAAPVSYDVRSIGVEAFKGKDVTSIDFDPECRIEYIGDYAFADTYISSFKLPASVTAIGNYAFYNTPDLFKVELNEGLASIGDGAFAAPEIRYGKVIVMPSTVNRIGADAFYNFECTKVETPDIASWCQIEFGSICANPIYNTGNLYVGDEQLTDLQIPEGIEAVMPYAFYNCNSLENVTFPEGLKRIGSESFYDCGSISDLRIPSSVVEIGKRVFANNTVTFSDGLSPIDIKADAFYYGVQNLYWGRPLDGGMVDLRNLSSLEIGGLVTEIPDGRFKDCWNLSSLTLGSGLKTIGSEAFSGCTWLWEVILPPSVETVGASAFAGDSGLERIIMGHNVKTIGERAFNGTVASTVSITAQVPPTAPNNTFSKYEGSLYLQGNEAVEAYSNASTCWNRFDSYVMVAPTGMDLKVDGEIGGDPGDTFQLTARLMPEDVTLPQIFWRSTNPAVATVDQNGLVTLHAENTEVTTRSGVLASCKIIAESLYADGPVAEVSLTGEIDGVDEILTESFGNGIDYSLPYDVYNMNGLKVGETTDGLSKGIYIIRQGKAAVKTVVK